MDTAIVLIKAQRDKVPTLGDKLSMIEGITEAYSVTGRYDFVAIVRAPDSETLAEIISNNLLKTTGIQRTETLMAFKCFSNYDLERMFSIGLD